MAKHQCCPPWHAQNVVMSSFSPDAIRAPLLDHRRNEMVLLNLVVNGVTLMFAVVSAVTGAFGMNLNAWMPQGTKSSAVCEVLASAPHFSAGTVFPYDTVIPRPNVVCLGSRRIVLCCRECNPRGRYDCQCCSACMLCTAASAPLPSV